MFDSTVARPSQKSSTGPVTAVVAVLLGGLAAGALWCLLALGLTHGAKALILVLGFALGFYFRWLGFAGRRGAICAIAATLVAFVYAQYLIAAVRIADMLGFALRRVLFKMDFALGWQIARANFSVWDFVWLVLACVIAARVMLRNSK